MYENHEILVKLMKNDENDEKWWKMMKHDKMISFRKWWKSLDLPEKKKLRRHLFGPGLIFGWELGHFPDFLEREKVES